MINIFILFPESEVDIFRYASEPFLVENLSTTILRIREYLRDNEIEFSFVYDSSILKTYINDVCILCDDKLIESESQKIVVALGRNSIDISKNNNSEPTHRHFFWNRSLLNIVPHSCLLIQNARFFESVGIFSFRSEDESLHSEIINIEDDGYSNDLPLLTKMRLFNSKVECIDWINSFIDHRFHLTNNKCFLKMPFRRGPKNYFKELATGHYWCYDYFHRDNKQHFEVFDKNGDHLCEANMEGQHIDNTKDSSKNIKNILTGK